MIGYPVHSILENDLGEEGDDSVNEVVSTLRIVTVCMEKLLFPLGVVGKEDIGKFINTFIHWQCKSRSWQLIVLILLIPCECFTNFNRQLTRVVFIKYVAFVFGEGFGFIRADSHGGEMVYAGFSMVVNDLGDTGEMDEVA